MKNQRRGNRKINSPSLFLSLLRVCKLILERCIFFLCVCYDVATKWITRLDAVAHPRHETVSDRISFTRIARAICYAKKKLSALLYYTTRVYARVRIHIHTLIHIDTLTLYGHIAVALQRWSRSRKVDIYTISNRSSAIFSARLPASSKISTCIRHQNRCRYKISPKKSARRY